MGTDAVIMAREDKRYFYFDRKRNFSYDYGPDAVLTLEEVVKVCTKNILENNANSWNESILAFAQRHKTNTFRIVSDHDGPDYNEIVEAEGYLQEGEEVRHILYSLHHAVRHLNTPTSSGGVPRLVDELFIALDIPFPEPPRPQTPEEHEAIVSLEKALSSGHYDAAKKPIKIEPIDFTDIFRKRD